MNNAGGHMVILAGAGLAAAFLSAYMLAARQGEPAVQEAVVVTLPQRIQPPVPQPAARPPAERPQPSVGPGPMSDPAALARNLQRELKRVGCYDGEASGVWSPASRAAMKAFTERVNASLPIDRPDPVLLALVQGHQGRACGDDCSAGEARTANGRCLPVAIIGRTEGKPAPAHAADAESKVEPSKAVPVPVPIPVPLPARKPPPPPTASIEPAPAPSPPRVAIAPPGPPPAPPTPVPKAALPVDPPDPQEAHAPRRPRHAGPGPAMRVYGRSIRRFVRRAPQQPAAVARSLLRSLERAAQGPW
jgi:hypothetical protein